MAVKVLFLERFRNYCGPKEFRRSGEITRLERVLLVRSNRVQDSRDGVLEVHAPLSGGDSA